MTTSKVMTVLGEIEPLEMGITHSHEHLFLKKGQAEKVDPALVIDNYDKTRLEVELAKSVGVSTIIDAQPVGSGRHAAWLEQVSRETGVHILASTGFHKLGFYPKSHWIRSTDYVQLAELFIRELMDGMYADGEQDWPSEHLTTRAGLIKTATDIEGTAGPYFSLFKAAAKASCITGSPIMSHTELGYNALDQIRLYEDFGVPAEKLIICHLDRKMENLDYMLHVANTGVYLELDTIGRFKYHSDEQEVELILRLLDAGYENQLLVSLDTTRKRMKHYDGGELGIDYLMTKFIPLLKASGVTDKEIKKMLHVNPSKAFTRR